MLLSLCKGILLLLGGVIFLATALPLLPANAWWVRIFDFPRAQIFFLGAVVFGLYALFFRPFQSFETAVLLLLLVSLVYQGWCIFPYTALAKAEVFDSYGPEGGGTLRLLVANVLMSNRRADALLGIIAKETPDVFLALEADRWWEKQLRPLEEELPHTLKKPLDNTYGMLLYSRRKFQESEIHFLLREDVPSFRVQFRLDFGELLVFWGLHPEPPTPAESESSTPRDAELLLVGRAVRDLPGPVIVAGDLNDVAWSRTTRLFQKISGLLDPRIGRGRFSTFHARYPILRWPLDHVFHSNHFRLVEIKVLPAIGSDHFPILVTLSFAPERKQEQKEPEAGGEDAREAREKVEKGMEEAR